MIDMAAHATLFLFSCSCFLSFLTCLLQGALPCALEIDILCRLIEYNDVLLFAEETGIEKEVELEFIKNVEYAYFACPVYEKLIPEILNPDFRSFSGRFGITPGIPCKPMLANPSRDFTEGFRRFGDQPIVCDFKYDGIRAQIHFLESQDILLFSRNCEPLSDRFPEVISSLRKVCIIFVSNFIFPLFFFSPVFGLRILCFLCSMRTI